MSHIEHIGVCYCACHDKSVPLEARERHIAACCKGICPYCDKRFTSDFHVTECARRVAEIKAEIEADRDIKLD
jgi:hypothetical protein